MTPKAPKDGRATGKSFKGTFQYLMHDKREEGEAVRTTTERVEWSEFRNLATDNPTHAYRMMAATAAQADELKRAAGGSPSGNKSDQVVFHYSLGWHPDEKEGLSKAEMLRAADESIRALGAEGNQAAIIAHNDTAHPHVHVVLNRVNPDDGKMLDLWKYQEKLSKWALSYEQQRGKVYCEQREENWKKREGGEIVNADRDAPYHLHDQAKTLGQANDNDTKKLLEQQKAKDAALARDGEAMHTRHDKQWKDLSEWYQQGKAKISGRDSPDRPTPFKQASDDVRAQFKPLRSALGRQQWQQMRDFEKRERGLLGKLENAVQGVSIERRHGGEQTSLFNHLLDSSVRKAALEKLHRVEWRNLNSGQRAEIDKAIAKVKKDQAAAYKAHKSTFDKRRDSLKTSQKEEKQELRQKWQTRKQERKRVSEIISKKQDIDQKRTETTKEHTSRGAARASFNKAKRAGRKRKGRVRKRNPN